MTTTSSATGGSFRVLPTLAMIAGAILFGVGLLFLPESVLGSIHVVGIGLSLFLSGLVATGWAADRWDLSPATQRTWSMAFAALAGLLLVLFVVVNWMTFESGELTGGSESSGE